MKKTDFEPNSKSKKQNESSPIKFDRCRLVSIVNGYMSCSCGDTQQYLMPCRHICAVINKKEYMTPELYNIRWYKTFAYYFLQDFSKDLVPTLLPTMTSIFNDSKSIDFSPITGRYKGIYIKDTQFYKEIDKNYSFQEDDVLSVMKSVRSMSLTSAVLRGSITISSIKKNYTSQLSLPNTDVINTNPIKETIEEFAINSQTEIQLSQQRQDMSNDTDNVDFGNTNSSRFQDAKALFKEVFYDCKTENEVTALMQTIRDFWGTMKSKNKVTMEEIQTGGMVMYGSNHTNKRKIGRKMSNAEKRLKKRKKTTTVNK